MDGRRVHLCAWALLAVAIFAQPWGLIAADTKHDLVANPAGFLSHATHAWTDLFTLGQLQNQAYGYLFPQGLFFLLAGPLPDWIAQRLWWTIVAGVGFSGFYRLCSHLRIGTPAFQILAAVLFALSPRTLTTLTAISSETWPVMLAPWVLLPLLRRGPITWSTIAAATIPIALMGAVNATATIAACVPAGIAVIWRRQWRAWLLIPAALMVSAWWIGPLLVLGRYAPPFTDYIESSFVTTRWLNLTEILRGTTHWTPFVDTEREAGHLLATEPIFILLTIAIAAAGLAGLALRGEHAPPLRSLWLIMLLVGVAILGADYGTLLDEWLAPLRNLHKFDPLVRIPLLVGIAALGSRLSSPRSTASKQPGTPSSGGNDAWLLLSRRSTATVALFTIAIASLAPVWSGRVLPTGAYEQVPADWHEATDFLNSTVTTRTLIAPETSFARQTWGWTRDEPAQPLLDVPWAVRDAVPLVPPEAIRGLDGVMATLDRSPDSLTRLGIGAVLIRHDLDSEAQRERADELDDALSEHGERHTFGDLTVVVLDAHRSMHTVPASDDSPLTVAGGGESLAVLDAIDGPAPRKLVEGNAQIVTDTPALVDRNFGTLRGAISAPLASPDDANSRNPTLDYPSAGPLTRLEVSGDIDLEASSQASDSTAFGGGDPARSLTAAVDGSDEAWWPAPGDSGTLRLRGPITAPELSITTTDDAELTITTHTNEDSNTRRVSTQADTPTSAALPHDEDDELTGVDIAIVPTTPTGIADLSVPGHTITRIVTVPDTSPQVQQFVFQRLTVDTGTVIRQFTAPRKMTVTVDTADDSPIVLDDTDYDDGEDIELSPGTHTLNTDAAWVSLREPDFEPEATYTEVDGNQIAASQQPRLLVTGRAYNSGLRGTLTADDGTSTELTPTTIDAATQAFELPADAEGTFRMRFAGETAYRLSLFGGAALGLITLFAALILPPPRRPDEHDAQYPPLRDIPASIVTVAAVITGGLVAGIPGALAAVAGWAVVRWTTIPAVVLAPSLVGVSGLWLARAPWPEAGYAGDSLLAACLAVGALACLTHSRAGSSTQV